MVFESPVHIAKCERELRVLDVSIEISNSITGREAKPFPCERLQDFPADGAENQIEIFTCRR